MLTLTSRGCTYRNHSVTHAEAFHWVKDGIRIHRAQRTSETSASFHDPSTLCALNQNNKYFGKKVLKLNTTTPHCAKAIIKQPRL